jgi:hypothetical protein
LPYDAFTIDTNTIIHGGMDFDAGLLGQLKQFRDGPVKFVVSEIVVRETLKHLQAQTKKTRDAALSSLNKAAGAGMIGEEAATAAKEALTDSREVARCAVEAFLEATGAEVVPANLGTVDGLLKAYFEPTAPFEASGDKKSEFPDAIALLSLEQWARSSGRTILAASADKGWKAFADKSDQISVEGDLGGALQIVQDDTNAAAAAISALLRRMAEGELGELCASINDHLSDALIDTEFEIEASSYLRYEVEASELKLEKFSFVEQSGEFAVTLVRLEAEESVIQVDVEITATAQVDFSLYAWDSIDREEIGIGTTSASTQETFRASILITLLGSLTGSTEDLDIDKVEVVEGLGTVSMGEIEMDYGEDERDDYDQLQLAMAAAAV